MARKRIIAGNWKMNYTAAQAAAFIGGLKPAVKEYRKAEICLCVPFTSLAAAKKALKHSKMKLAAQNVAWAERGAFTGEVSAEMLLEAGAEYVVIGHSERRQMFGETDASVNKRAHAALKSGLKPIICVGETESERLEDKTAAVLTAQVKAALEGITPEEIQKSVIAYEPVWAIGTGKNATAVEAASAIAFIRKIVAGLYGGKIARGLRILYGGSMNGKNCAELLAQKEIDGGLIGGASLKAEEFVTIIKSAQ